MICFSCQKENSVDGKPGFRADCFHCGADLHVCKNCAFFDPRAYNECRESSADRQTEKERSNFCEYFKVQTDSNNKNTPVDPAAEAKRKLEELFKKK